MENSDSTLIIVGFVTIFYMGPFFIVSGDIYNFRGHKFTQKIKFKKNSGQNLYYTKIHVVLKIIIVGVILYKDIFAHSLLDL